MSSRELSEWIALANIDDESMMRAEMEWRVNAKLGNR
jgi:hypothetical protein